VNAIEALGLNDAASLAHYTKKPGESRGQGRRARGRVGKRGGPNIQHIAEQDLRPEEVEQVFSNEPLIVAIQEHEDEERALCFGRTNAGRFLTVIYTERKERIRVVTAYRMTRAQQRLYLTGRGNG
jgi:hypothetical protein